MKFLQTLIHEDGEILVLWSSGVPRILCEVHGFTADVKDAVAAVCTAMDESPVVLPDADIADWSIQVQAAGEGGIVGAVRAKMATPGEFAAICGVSFALESDDLSDASTVAALEAYIVSRVDAITSGTLAAQSLADDTYQQVLGAINFCASQRKITARDVGALFSRASGAFEVLLGGGNSETATGSPRVLIDCPRCGAKPPIAVYPNLLKLEQALEFET